MKPTKRKRNESGITLLEVLVAGFILVFVMLAMVRYYQSGRVFFDREEWKRKAIAITQQRFEDVRRFYRFTEVTKDAVDTTITVDNITYTMESTVEDATPIVNNKRITITTKWKTQATGEDRQIVGTFIYFRGRSN
jgi:Tfp pilus assembly protein PilV